jgi:hypothetical protein
LFLIEGDPILRNLLKNQITHLNIDIKNKKTREACRTVTNIFQFILSLCERLVHLNFRDLFSHRKIPVRISNLSLISCISSTLNKLIINVMIFDDCLYLLDGRLQSLSTLIIHVSIISSTLSRIDYTVSVMLIIIF